MAQGDTELDETLNLDPPEDPVDDQTDDTDEPDEQSEDGEAEDAEQTEEVEARGEEPPSTERRPSRAESRIETLRREIKERDQRLAETNRRIDTLLAGQRYTQPQGETAEQRATRLALMTPEERIAESLAAAETRHSQQLQHIQATVQDSTDKAAFQAKATVDPLYAKWAPKVEARLAEARNHPDPSQRFNVPREALFYYMIGEAAIAGRKSKDVTAQRTRATQRVASARTRPAGGRSDTGADRRGATDDLERRLSKATF